jgi:hypothetical protein
MALAIVWRNPKPLSRTKQTVQRIQGDHPCAVYVVTDAEQTQQFSSSPTRLHKTTLVPSARR